MKCENVKKQMLSAMNQNNYTSKYKNPLLFASQGVKESSIHAKQRIP